jgi:hypothetical protein
VTRSHHLVFELSLIFCAILLPGGRVSGSVKADGGRSLTRTCPLAKWAAGRCAVRISAVRREVD